MYVHDNVFHIFLYDASDVNGSTRVHGTNVSGDKLDRFRLLTIYHYVYIMDNLFVSRNENSDFNLRQRQTYSQLMLLVQWSRHWRLKCNLSIHMSHYQKSGV